MVREMNECKTDEVLYLFNGMMNSDLVFVPVFEMAKGVFPPRSSMFLDEYSIVSSLAGDLIEKGYFNLSALIRENSEVRLPAIDKAKRSLLFIEASNPHSNLYLRKLLGEEAGTVYFGFYHVDLHSWVIGSIKPLEEGVDIQLYDMDVSDSFVSDCFKVGSAHTCMIPFQSY